MEKGNQPFILIVGSFTAEQAKDTLNGFLNMVQYLNEEKLKLNFISGRI